jgi:hypothetical protein
LGPSGRLTRPARLEPDVLRHRSRPGQCDLNSAVAGPQAAMPDHREQVPDRGRPPEVASRPRPSRSHLRPRLPEPGSRSPPQDTRCPGTTSRYEGQAQPLRCPAPGLLRARFTYHHFAELERRGGKRLPASGAVTCAPVRSRPRETQLDMRANRRPLIHRSVPARALPTAVALIIPQAR